MRIVGIEGMTASELNSEVQRGANFVIYQYCIYLLVVTFKRSSDIYFVRTGESNPGKIAGYTAVSLLLGWWGIPWGPIYTIQAVVINLRGGKNITQEVITALNAGAKA